MCLQEALILPEYLLRLFTAGSRWVRHKRDTVILVSCAALSVNFPVRAGVDRFKSVLLEHFGIIASAVLQLYPKTSVPFLFNFVQLLERRIGSLNCPCILFTFLYLYVQVLIYIYIGVSIRFTCLLILLSLLFFYCIIL